MQILEWTNIVEIGLGLQMDKVGQFLTGLFFPPHDSGTVLLFHLFICI